MTLRIRNGLPSLRASKVFSAVRKALAAGKGRFGFTLVEFSVQSNHLHPLVEADDRRALSRGMQGLCAWRAR